MLTNEVEYRMLLLSLTCLRADVPSHSFTKVVLQGTLREAVRMAAREAVRGQRPAAQSALEGQIVMRAFLGLGDEEEAEELMRKQLRFYESVSRATVRWCSGLDHGVMFLQRRQMARAAKSFAVPADDPNAPVPLRVEALAGLAQAFSGMGEHSRSHRLLGHALNLARALRPEVGQLLQAMQLEMRVLEGVHISTVVASGGLSRRPCADRDQLVRSVRDSTSRLADIPLAAERMRFVGALLRPGDSLPDTAGKMLTCLAWLKARRLAGYEEQARIEAALVFMRHVDHHHAAELTGLLCMTEAQVHRHRRAAELLLCLSHLHAAHGRHAEALRLYRVHAEMCMSRLRRDLAQMPHLHNLDEELLSDHSADVAQLRLPPRYRKAYAFMLDHLGDQALSIKQVASHVDVTERALQMAFRTYLGMTPAELIRQRRQERIQAELQSSASPVRAVDVAARWGIGAPRSTV